MFFFLITFLGVLKQFVGYSTPQDLHVAGCSANERARGEGPEATGGGQLQEKWLLTTTFAFQNPPQNNMG